MDCHFLLQRRKVKSQSEVVQLCSTLSDPLDCSLPGSSTHGIFQAYCHIAWFALETSRDYSAVFETEPKYCILDSFVDYEGYSISFSFLFYIYILCAIHKRFFLQLLIISGFFIFKVVFHKCEFSF